MEQYPKVGDFVAYFDPAIEKHSLGVIAEITNKYPIEMPQMASYTIFWTHTKNFVCNYKAETAKNYKNIFEEASNTGLLVLKDLD
jgi:hypothetical protein